MAAMNKPVLVVEDEAIIRMMLAEELEEAGFVVFEAEDADAAVAQMIDCYDIGLVLTDVRMPGSMDGLGLARWMRTHRGAVPIIITSGFATPPDIDAINPAIVRIVAKPYLPHAALGWLAAIGFENGSPEIPINGRKLLHD